MLGYKQGEEKIELMKFAKCVILPSEWYEQMPLVVLESYHFFTPVIASDLGSIPEIVIDGKTGYLFRQGNSNDLANKIKTLFYNKILIKTFGEKWTQIFERKIFIRIKLFNVNFNL